MKDKNMRTLFSLFVIVLLPFVVLAQTLNLPPRPSSAPVGSVFITTITPLSLTDRENAIYQQIASGNIPDFLRTLVPITSTAVVGGVTKTARYYATPDYLAIGSNEDYFLCPMTPLLAQRVADLLGCTLPTKKMVDQIYLAATVKLAPKPIPPSGAMTTVPVFSQHNDSVWLQRSPLIPTFPLGSLVGGTKKDVIISNKIYTRTTAPLKPVVIYGWHQLNGLPIQPVYNGHEETYADYSHGIRMVQSKIALDSASTSVQAILADVALALLLSDEDVILKPRYGAWQPVTPKPGIFGVIRESAQALRIPFVADDTVTICAYSSRDGITFGDSIVLQKSYPVIDNLKTDTLYFFKLRGYSSAGSSQFSEVLGGIPSASNHTTLVINGFDRASTGNTYNFVRQHGQALKNNGYAFSSATNDAIVKGLVSLSNYTIADVILGDESTVDETLSTVEQETVKTFLQNGGSLFVSGSEIAWDLDFKGSTTDKDFCSNYLKTKYIADAPNSQAAAYYQAQPITGGIFDGLGSISFDNGTQGTINVKYPDAIDGTQGGIVNLTYVGASTFYAGVSYAGWFPSGVKKGKVVTMGIPFETIYPDSVRNLVMKKVIQFFEAPVEVTRSAENLPNKFALYQNYPNPCNPSTTIRFETPGNEYIAVEIYDLTGRILKTPMQGVFAAGQYRVALDVSTFPSGVLFYRLRGEAFLDVKKMIVLK